MLFKCLIWFPCGQSIFQYAQKISYFIHTKCCFGDESIALSYSQIVRLKSVHSWSERVTLNMCVDNDGPIYIWWGLAGEKRAHYNLHVDSEFSFSPSCSAASCPVIFWCLEADFKVLPGVFSESVLRRNSTSWIQLAATLFEAGLIIFYRLGLSLYLMEEAIKTLYSVEWLSCQIIYLLINSMLYLRWWPWLRVNINIFLRNCYWVM